MGLRYELLFSALACLILCSPAYWLHASNSTCDLCPKGSYADKGPKSNCSLLDREGLCGNGSCPVEPPNYHGQGFNGTLCTRCKINQFQNETGQSSCLNCSVGHQPSINRDSCIQCNPGEISNQTSTQGLCSSCYGIAPGFVADKAGGRCVSCTPGMMSLDGISCTGCQHGYYWNPTTHVCFDPCPAGHSCTESQGPIKYCQGCNPCPAGHVQPQKGQYECKPCPAGSFQGMSGQTYCHQCSPGQVQPDEGQPQCNTCAQGFYCPNATSQVPCPGDAYCPSGSTHPKYCPTLFQTSNNGCTPTAQMYGIITGATLCAVALIALFVYHRVRVVKKQKLEERRRLLTAQQSKQPVYLGL